MMLRLVEVKKGSKWIIVRMDQVTKGDTFRLTEPDGTPVKIGRRRNFVALSDAYQIENEEKDINNNAIWTVEVVS